MRLHFAKQFLRQYKKLPKVLRDKTDERLRLFAREEWHSLLDNHKLTGEWAGCRSINVTGDCRIIFEEYPNNTTFVHAVGTHSELYGN